MGADKIMVARYRDTCSDCGGDICKGDEIRWSRREGARHNFDCSDAEGGAESRRFDLYIDWQEQMAA